MFSSLPARSAPSAFVAVCLVFQLAWPVSLVAQESMMAAKPAARVEPVVSGRPLTGDEKILQVLNRFTYGPRPGDLERVRAIGIKAWFDQQLNPESIDDSALDQRLANYPAMQMPLGQLMAMYPLQGTIRAAMDGKGSIPGGAAEQAIYADEMARYANKKKNGKDKTAQRDEDAAPLPRPAEDIAALPPDPRFKAMCKLTVPQLRELRKNLTEDQREHLTDGFTPEQTEALAAFQGPKNVVAAEDVQVKLLRDVYSERQLNEVMVDFWLNHFNVYIKKSQQAPYYIASYERDAIRPQALGRFENLLLASATSPAMLNYLDNASSVGPRSEFAERGGGRGKKKASGLNENYGRELMELHTVGVNGGYTQQDVTNAAKVFTGWTVGKKRGADVPAQAEFDPSKHEPGDKVVLGVTIKESGQKEGLQLLHMLANSPHTARFISTKLAVRFVSDEPPPAMVDRMTSAFMESHGDIRRVLAAMVNSPEFFSAGQYRVKVKTPQDYVVSAVRAAGSHVESTAGLATAIADLGMPLYGMQTPNGYSMKNAEWNNTAALVSRMNFALALSTNRVAGVSTDFNALLGGQAGTLTPDEKDKALEKAILHVLVSQRTQELILAQTSTEERELNASLRQVSAVQGKRDPLAMRAGGKRRIPDGGVDDAQAALAAGLIFGSPEFQRR